MSAHAQLSIRFSGGVAGCLCLSAWESVTKLGRNLLSSAYIVNWPISIEPAPCKVINSVMLYLDIVVSNTQTFRGKMIERQRNLNGLSDWTLKKFYKWCERRQGW